MKYYFSKGQIDKMEAAADKELELNPNDAQTLAIVGSALATRDEREHAGPAEAPGEGRTILPESAGFAADLAEARQHDGRSSSLKAKNHDLGAGLQRAWDWWLSAGGSSRMRFRISSSQFNWIPSRTR